MCVVLAFAWFTGHNPARRVSLQPNSYSRLISVEGEKKIVIFALRSLQPGHEVTYDYKVCH